MEKSLNEIKSEVSVEVDEITEPTVEKIPFKVRVKSFFVKYKVPLYKLAFVLCVIAGISVGFYFIFDAFGLMNKKTAADAFADKGIWIYIIFLCLFVLSSVCLCMVPGSTTVFIYAAIAIFPSFWIAILVCIIGVWLSGITLFFIGRYAGRPVIYWMFGKEKVNKGLEWITRKGAPVLPVFFLIPFMPNDMICAVCGMSRLKLWQFLMVIIPFRIIEVLMISSYQHVINFFFIGRDPLEILLVVNLGLIDLFLIILYWRTIVRVFRKTILRKKYVAVEKPYVIEEEVKKKK